MGSTLLKKAIGLSSASDFLDKNGLFYNYNANRLPSFDYDKAGKHIARENKSWSGYGENQMGQSAEVTYSFPTWSHMPTNIFGDKNPYQFNLQQKEQAKFSLNSWADVANITFKEVAPRDNADIQFGNIKDKYGSFQAYATLPHTKLYGDSGPDVSGQAWFSDYKYAGNTTPELGNYGRLTLVHEIGHTLGLMHPGDYNAGQNVPGYLKSDYAEDSRQYTVMSYWEEYETGAFFDGVYAGAPLLHDISAIQYLYGANTSVRTGNDIYGFNSNTNIDYFTATSSHDKLIFSVWDNGGYDTFDFSGFYQNQTIDLREMHYSNVGGLVKNVSIAKGVVIEEAIGGSGNDIIIGNDADNWLSGGAGNDIIYGGAGNDHIYGGAGQDTLWGAGRDIAQEESGNNTFVYKDISDSTFEFADIIMDFKTGKDKIDLTDLIKNTFYDNSINYVDQLSGKGGELAINYNDMNDMSEVLINAYGHYNPEFKIDIVGVITPNDFIV
ncbi:serralysin family metalloprotease [Proteus myxofaciens]|uniref:serralysin n=1 Tax=Proteus myxofaciens ATCC 19692 TaxID=1354337 RepID=A0A198FJP0_9GAMM|nr:serralysin family metalloprotease [Proteus myxofaciens]OAT24985.1 secreted alkaline metalloproteinase [Proteus myxofaciens ATCC 19692]